MRNIEISRITDAYRQEAREAVLKAVEKHRGYFRMLVQSNMEQEDCYFVDKAKAYTNLEALVPDYNEIISALIAECRIPVPETEPGTVNIPADASEL